MELGIQRHRVHSSNVASVGWQDNIMEVAFKNGGVYRYYNVPEDVYEGMLRTPSVGKYLHREVKGKYMFRKVG